MSALTSEDLAPLRRKASPEQMKAALALLETLKKEATQ